MTIIRDKLRPAREYGSVLFYVHGKHEARWGGKPWTAASSFTHLLNSAITYRAFLSNLCSTANEIR